MSYLETELDITQKRAVEAHDACQQALDAEDVAYTEAQNLRDKARTLESEADAVVIAAGNAQDEAEDAYDAAWRASNE